MKNFKEIPVTNNYDNRKVFYVSTHRYNEIIQYKWFVTYSGYKNKYFRIRRQATEEEIAAGAPLQISIHRQILGLHLKRFSRYELIRHLDENTFNNTDENLSLGTPHQNMRDRTAGTRKGKGLWGVSHDSKRKTKNVWLARVRHDDKNLSPKPRRYSTEEEAHEAAVKLYKELTGKDPVITL